MSDLRTYTVQITRQEDDPEKEFHIQRAFVLKDGRPDEGFEKTLFLQEMEITWRQLHRFIRRTEVGEE